MKKWTKLWSSLVLAGMIGLLAACGNSAANGGKTIKIGATAGPYYDMVTKAIKPELEKKGYQVEAIEFTDYVQPNTALSEGDLDANLFQHEVFMKAYNKENNKNLAALISVPTAPMGLYSSKYKHLQDIKPGAEVAIPNDPANAARAFLTLKDQGLIQLKDGIDTLKASERDITNNPKKLTFKQLESANLPRAVEDLDIAAVPGNFALSANMKLQDALALENMPDRYRNQVVVDGKNKDKQFAKDLKEAVESKAFEETIDKEFAGFGKPKWMTE
ncbi:MetQ/NlpA family ABC transporter substrate-binding protein [Bacillus sonorensis]|uniref:MetQ/NlpA family ABC transporter substrate-binding protein n=1 Tax=Bacillus sonorensis TaxID=119858 RepID=UPI002DB8ACE2|nr:MetQ/NlpA family ABC transporter substrate-binding protein [Bacillus sonorensis]MEC1439666.1 MetQ/NlpA family ABC transporter substrate-binding protein [Bacillus sonorensis]MEC1500030.1 MetQ/NlpA family ABC transporter substrate-binding protein [Bacillus sonorensis]